MKPKASPLTVIDFAILNLELNFIQPQDESSFDIKKAFDEYEMDIDFSISGKEMIQVVIKVEINRGKEKLPGYSIFAESGCLFEFKKNMEIQEDAKNSMGGFSTIYIALNALRGFISQITANAPLGRYILPSIDLNDLIQQKQTELAALNAKQVNEVETSQQPIKGKQKK
jgi:preprotein translocase subunit SecB